MIINKIKNLFKIGLYGLWNGAYGREKGCDESEASWVPMRAVAFPCWRNPPHGVGKDIKRSTLSLDEEAEKQVSR